MSLVDSALSAAAAFAAWYVNSDGTGFVGKGDVQLAFGWSNKALNDNAASVSFNATTVAFESLRKYGGTEAAQALEKSASTPFVKLC